MKLREAWNKVKGMEKAERLASKQVYSILADLGVFKESPRLQTITKVALQDGLWSIIYSSNILPSDIERIHNQLDFHGFSKSIINEMFSECNFGLASNKSIQIPQYQSSSSSHSDISKHEVQQSSSILLSDSSSDSDIEDYLNSVFEIDYESFKKHGLTLQRIEPIEWKLGAGLYHNEFGACFSYEVIGNTKFQGDINVDVYDLNGFLRGVNYISGVCIQGKYSVVNENKVENLILDPKNISKIVLRVGLDGVLMENAFYGETGPIFKYMGLVENNTDNFEIKFSQILYASARKEDNISVFLKYKIKHLNRPIRRVGEKNLHIALFDKNGLIRQRISLTTGTTYYGISSKNDNAEHYMFSSSRWSSMVNPTLKMSFDEIGKIVFFEE